KLSLWFPPIASALGFGYMQSGRAGDALSLLERAVEQSEGMRLGGWHSRVLTGLGLAYLLTGRANEALQAVRRALALAREHKERGHEAWSLRILGELPLRSELGGPDAEEALQRALSLATELEMRPLMAHGRFGLGRWLARAGRRQDGETHLRAAATLFGELGMRFWAAQVDAALADLHWAAVRLGPRRLDLQILDAPVALGEPAEFQLERLGVVRIEASHDPDARDAFRPPAPHGYRPIVALNRLARARTLFLKLDICFLVRSVLNFSVIFRD